MAHHLTIRSIGTQPSDAIGHALRVIAQVVARPDSPGYSTSCHTGSAEATLDPADQSPDTPHATDILLRALAALPVGFIPAHTLESLPDRIANLVGRLAATELERDNAESDRKQAESDTLRALHERNEARQQRDRLAEAFTSPASYYLAGLRDLLSASLLHLLHHAGAAGLTVALVRDTLRGAEHAAIFDAFQRLHRAGLASAPQRHTGRGRPYAWTITPAGSAVVTRPFSPALTIQPLLATSH